MGYVTFCTFQAIRSMDKIFGGGGSKVTANRTGVASSILVAPLISLASFIALGPSRTIAMTGPDVIAISSGKKVLKHVRYSVFGPILLKLS